MKKIIVITVTVIAVTLGAAALYTYVLGGALPFGITLPGQPDFKHEQIHRSDDDGTEGDSLSFAVVELFSKAIVIKEGEIISFGDTIPLLSSASGLYTFAPYFPAGEYKVAGFDCGRPMVLYLDYDRNYYCMVKPVTDIVFQLLSKGPPYLRTAGSEDGNMTAELLIAQDTLGYRFAFAYKDRTNETKSAAIRRDSLVHTMADIYNQTSSELAVTKNLYDSITGGPYFKQLIHLDYGFTVDAGIRSYDPQDKRINLYPKGGLCITDITVSKKTTVSKNLLKRVGPIGADSYYLAYRQPLSGNIVIALPDGESFLYVSLSGAGDTPDDELYEFMLSVLTVDYAGSLALSDEWR